MCKAKYLDKQIVTYLNHFLCKIIQKAFYPYVNGVLVLIIISSL